MIEGGNFLTVWADDADCSTTGAEICALQTTDINGTCSVPVGLVGDMRAGGSEDANAADHTAMVKGLPG